MAKYESVILLSVQLSMTMQALSKDLNAGHKGQDLVMLPLGDLLDHDPSSHVAWHLSPDDEAAFHLVTYSGIKQVQQHLQARVGFSCILLCCQLMRHACGSTARLAAAGDIAH